MNSNEIYASADFPDAELGRPLDFSFGEGISYSLALTNAVSKHISELREKNSDSIDTIWKKRFKEFLVSKNEKLLEFLTVKIKNHPILGKTEHFFQLFGTNNRYFNINTIQEIALDLSGAESNKDIVNALCLSNEFQTIDKYVEQTQYLLNLYKECVDKILTKELDLSIKLEQFDSIHTNLKGLSKLTVNDSYNPMMEGVQNYLEKLFEENQFEETYNDIIESYRKFLLLREVLQVIRKRESVESEPLCTICFTDKVSYAFSPCGHTFCIGCVKKQSHSCSICRSSIRERVKIYFS
jgi:hypothetical protein